MEDMQKAQNKIILSLELIVFLILVSIKLKK